LLRVIKKMKEKSSLSIKSSFLGAHTYPLSYRDNHRGYIDLIKNEMLPVIAAQKLADYIDVFCEEGFFSPEEAEEICRAGMKVGLQPKIHANQMHHSGGTQLGVKLGALSVDHLDTGLGPFKYDWHAVANCCLFPPYAFPAGQGTD
jgi:imidazolonepropionase